MRKLISLILISLPTLIMASTFDCTGAGFSLEGETSPAEMRINGNVFKDIGAINVKVATAFDTVVTGNTVNPTSTLKLTIRDGSGCSSLTVYSSIGIKEFQGLSWKYR